SVAKHSAAQTLDSGVALRVREPGELPVLLHRGRACQDAADGPYRVLGTCDPRERGVTADGARRLICAFLRRAQEGIRGLDVAQDFADFREAVEPRFVSSKEAPQPRGAGLPRVRVDD